MHGANPIALAIPLFLLAIALEWGVARRRGVKVYRFADALADLGCGVSSQALGVLLQAATLGVYAYVYAHARRVSFAPGSAWPWVLGMLGVDFVYYWWHRLSHEVNALWAAHVVHHQSEDYNLAVALRQAWFTGLTGVPFYLPLALLGVHPLAYAASLAASLLYQFWIHTELVGKLGWYEWLFNTPSHHRVHHATNPEYLDKNYGGILIVWDRLFGTFEPERTAPVYGLTKPFASLDPVWANLAYWVEMARLARARRGLGAKLRVLVERPGYDPVTRRVTLPPFTPRERFVKFEPPALPRRRRALLGAEFVLVALCTGAYLLATERLGIAPRALGAAALVLATWSWAGTLERRAWAGAARVGWLVLAGACVVLGLTAA